MLTYTDEITVAVCGTPIIINGDKEVYFLYVNKLLEWKVRYVRFRSYYPQSLNHKK